MLRTQLPTRTTCSKRTSRELAGGRDDDADQRLALRAGARGGRRRGRPSSRSTSGRQADPVAVGLDRPGAGFEGPRLGRLAAAGGRGLEHAPVVEDRGTCSDRAARARSPSAPGPSPGSPRTRGRSRRPPRPGSRRRTLRWQVYICVRIRSGDQSGLEEGAGVVAGAVDLVFVGVDVVGLGVGGDRLVRRGRGRRGEGCRRGRAGRRTRPRPSPGRRWRRRRCRRSLARSGPGCGGSARLRLGQHRAHVRLLASSRRPGTAPSRRSVWRADRLQHRRQHVGRRVVDGGEDREAGCRHGVSPGGRGGAAGR